MGFLQQLLFPCDDRKYFRMLVDLSTQVYRGAAIFKDFVDTYEQLSDQERGQRAADIKEIEHRCDELSHIIIMQLNKAEDVSHAATIHAAASLLATVMDGISAVSKRMLLFGVAKPNDDLKQFALLVHNSCKELPTLMQQFYAPHRAHQVITRIHGIEREADYIHNLAMASLFANKRDARELVIFKDLYDLLEEIVDNTEYLARVIENLVAKEHR